MKFQTFGPFSVPLSVVLKMDALSTDFDRARPGLNNASGVYIFARRLEGKLVPIYVGQTQRDSFGGRIPHHFNQPSNQGLANTWDDPTADICLFLIALVDDSGDFRRSKDDAEHHFDCIIRLEDLLIGTCWEVNRELLNIKGVRFYRDIHVPGYLNSRPQDESDGSAALSLAKMLRKSK